ncbi:MAG: Nucleoside-triphosphatase [Rickettsiales bacterium]|jgi:XTP/dITP diphosphohydrolase|nr:Nucleoside-triphosphatase [Rickettsiales bacterium]
MPRLFKESSLLIASGNNGKIKEIQELLAPYPVKVRSTAEFTLEEPEEDADSFTGNALIKAKYYSEQTGLPALADDSGLVIPALGGKPGIHSARWAGPDKDFDKASNRIRQELFAVHGDEYTINDPAWFACVLAIYWPEDGHSETFEGRVDGHLQFPPKGEHGFGYDPIFVPENETRTFAQMESKEKHTLSHRARAFNALVKGCFSVKQGA